MNRSKLTAISLILIAAVLTVFSLWKLDIIKLQRLSFLVHGEIVCDQEASSTCYSEQYWEGTLNNGMLLVEDNQYPVSAEGGVYSVAGQEVQVFMPRSLNTTEGEQIIFLDLAALLEQTQSQELCVKGRYLSSYKVSDQKNVSFPYQAEMPVLEMYLCDENSYHPNIYVANLNSDN